MSEDVHSEHGGHSEDPVVEAYKKTGGCTHSRSTTNGPDGAQQYWEVQTSFLTSYSESIESPPRITAFMAKMDEDDGEDDSLVRIESLEEINQYFHIKTDDDAISIPKKKPKARNYYRYGES